MTAPTDKPRSTEPGIKPETPAPDGAVPSMFAKNLTHSDANFMNVVPETLKPGLHYRWVRSRQDESHLQVHRAKMAGYDFVKAGEVQLLVSPDNRGDNKIYVADCVLMSCPKAVHAQRQAQKRQRREATLASTSAVTKQKAKELGVKLIETDD